MQTHSYLSYAVRFHWAVLSIFLFTNFWTVILWVMLCVSFALSLTLSIRRRCPLPRSVSLPIFAPSLRLAISGVRSGYQHTKQRSRETTAHITDENTAEKQTASGRERYPTAVDPHTRAGWRAFVQDRLFICLCDAVSGWYTLCFSVFLFIYSDGVYSFYFYIPRR